MSWASSGSTSASSSSSTIRAPLPLVTDVLGRDIYVYHCHLDVHPPSNEPPRWRWHQDGGRQNVELESPRPLLSLKVGYFLTDVEDVDMGPLWVLRGSQRRDTLDQPADGSLRPPGAEPLLVPRGTAVVFDRRLWHARGRQHLAGDAQGALRRLQLPLGAAAGRSRSRSRPARAGRSRETAAARRRQQHSRTLAPD